MADWERIWTVVERMNLGGALVDGRGRGIIIPERAEDNCVPGMESGWKPSVSSGI